MRNDSRLLRTLGRRFGRPEAFGLALVLRFLRPPRFLRNFEVLQLNNRVEFRRIDGRKMFNVYAILPLAKLARVIVETPRNPTHKKLASNFLIVRTTFEVEHFLPIFSEVSRCRNGSAHCKSGREERGC